MYSLQIFHRIVRLRYSNLSTAKGHRCWIRVTKAATRGVLKVIFKILQNSQENTCARVPQLPSDFKSHCGLVACMPADVNSILIYLYSIFVFPFKNFIFMFSLFNSFIQLLLFIKKFQFCIQ